MSTQTHSPSQSNPSNKDSNRGSGAREPDKQREAASPGSKTAPETGKANEMDAEKSSSRGGSDRRDDDNKSSAQATENDKASPRSGSNNRDEDNKGSSRGGSSSREDDKSSGRGSNAPQSRH